MADEVTAPLADSEPTFTPALPADTGAIDARSAARAITEARQKALTPPTEKPTPEQPRERGRFVSAAAPPEPALEGADAAADPDQPPGDTDQGLDPADEQPTIDPPRSWTKEDKEAFRLLPPDRQQSIVDTERKRDAEIRRGQDEVANERKAIEAERQATLQARQQYESAAQNALSILQTQQAAEFGDIKTDADVMKLATEDPFRFSQWQARQMQIERQHREVQTLNYQREQEKAEHFKTWSQEQDDKFVKQFPEFADTEKVGKVRQGIISYLTKEAGVPEDKLEAFYKNPLFRDAIFQRVVYDGYRFHAAQQAAKSAVQAPKPQVQRPGVAPQRGQQIQDEIAAVQTRLKSARGMDATRAAADLIAAKRKASGRR